MEKDRPGLDFGIWQTHRESLSTLTVLSHWALKARLENHFRHTLSLLQCCECRDAIVQLTGADLHFCAVRALPGKEIGMQFQTGVTGRGWGKGAVSMPKGPRGSTSHGVCLLKGSCFVGDYIPGSDYVYPRVNFGL